MSHLTRRSFTAGALALGASAPVFARDHHAGGWQEIPSLPIVAQEIYPAVLGRNIYVAGGFTVDEEGNFSVSRRTFVYGPGGTNPVTGEFNVGAAHGAWFEVEPMPDARHHPNLVGHDDAVYSIGGYRAIPGRIWDMLNHVTRFDPTTNSWTEMRPLPRNFGETCAVSLGGEIHVATGRQPRSEDNDNAGGFADTGRHYVYNAQEDSWREAAPNPNVRNSGAGTVLNGRFHVVAGRRMGGGNIAHHEAYDRTTDSWERLAPMPQAQGGLACAALDGKLYAFGGEWFNDGGGVYPNTWVYDPEADSWSAGPDMRTPRHGLGGVTVDGKIYAIAGATIAGGNGTTGIVEVLEP